MEYGRIGIWGNTGKPGVARLATDLAGWIEAQGRRPVLAEALARLLHREKEGVADDRLAGAVDLLVSLGGDGSLLHSARLVSAAGVPILGVNLGRLGFLAEIGPDGIEDALGRILDGRSRIEERMNLEALLVRGEKTEDRFVALNDVVVDRGASPRVLEIDVRVGGVPVTAYTGDGVIVSTPTGSTGHSLSAGGPVVSPCTRLIIVTPICAHSLAARTIIVSDGEAVDIEVRSEAREARLAVDGQLGRAVLDGDRLALRAASQVTRLVRLNDTSFYEILRTKFRWGNPRQEETG
jgi:NAD+ kinase